jgi:UDP-N-acetylglucosamine diphosphorylase/glucosamine-1-phosphate N-acetyltransferase
MHVVIFEGSRWHTFAPLSLSRPVFTLVSGMSTLLEKQVRHMRPTRLSLWVRPELEDHCRARLVPKIEVPTEVNKPLDDEPALLINGRALLFGHYEYPPEDAVVADEENLRVRSARVTSPGLSPDDLFSRTPKWMRLLELPHTMAQCRLVESLWDLIHWNEESLFEDSLQLRDTARSLPAGPFHLVNDDEIWIGQDCKLEPGCVLDASKGPIVLGDHVAICANAVLKGPCHVGNYSSVLPLSIIRPGTSLGTMCKVGGEVSNSIIMGYSNKSHEGYLGDSYIGRWVNLGAGTTTSNLKNTYGEISVKRGDKEIPTGRRFLGALIGDHTKTGILSRIMAGSYIGFGASISTSQTVPRWVPSFTFISDRGSEPYDMDKAIEVTRQVYSRRDRPWTATDERVMRYVAEVAPGVEAG